MLACNYDQHTGHQCGAYEGVLGPSTKRLLITVGWLHTALYLPAYHACQKAKAVPNQATLVCVLCRPGVLMFNYAVAYSIADPVTKIPTPAGVALARALATAEGRQTSQMVLPLLLASSHQATVRDFSKGMCH